MFSRRSLLAAIGLALPGVAAATAADAKSPLKPHHKAHHPVHAASSHLPRHHRKPAHHAAAASALPPAHLPSDT